MESKDIFSMMKKFGKVRKSEGKIIEVSVICTVCGKKITCGNANDVHDVEFSMTKRKTPVFVHSKCVPDVWNSKIHWEAPK